MPEETQKTFDDIKPFLRMLEGSIDRARAKRLEKEDEHDQPAETPGNSPPQANSPSAAEPTRLMARPKRPGSLNHSPSAGERNGSNAQMHLSTSAGVTDASSTWIGRPTDSSSGETNGQATGSDSGQQATTRLAHPKYQWK